jgi:adenosylcobyric acid synthase
MKTPSHGGNLDHLAKQTGLSPDQILDFSANINPLGPPEWLRPVVSSVLGSVVHYPDPDCSLLTEAAAQRYGVAQEQVIVGNGSTEIIHLLPRALDVSRALIVAPTYVDYRYSTKASRLDVSTLLLKESDGFAVDFQELEKRLSSNLIVFLCQPNNPTGLVFGAQRFRKLAAEHPTTYFVVDEAFRDFVEDVDSLTSHRPKNVMVMLSLTKIYAIPGIRLGCAVADESVVESIAGIQPFWSVNTIAQAVGVAALRDEDYVNRGRKLVTEQRETLTAELESLGDLTVYPGRANFLLLRVDRTDIDAVAIADRTLQNGVAIRVCDNFDGLDTRFFRVAVRNEEENHRLCDALRKALGIFRKTVRKRHTPAIMFQGTSSNAGKSVLTAALCRILLNDGYRVAPYKSQNMSLNSFVTRDGGEMGRAQVVQAQACRLDPDVRMNPILLKPNSDTGSQVILLGKPVGNMDVIDYVEYKSKAFATAKEAYDSLAEEHDVVVLEGAGSPAEVNLKHHDIVNMQMARYAHAPVLLVGDIDRGGVFGSFVGTMEVLAEWERSLVAGFVVNRFRGDASLLDDALAYTLRHTGRPVYGVVNYFADLGLPEEDSVSFKEGLFEKKSSDDHSVEIAIVDLPHISNFTDFEAFLIEPDVKLTMVRKLEDLNNPDAVILPGSKNVIGDLEHLRTKGLESKIRDLIARGQTEVVGLCGGFQMIGSEISDPHHLESDGKTLKGLDFMKMNTVLAPDKTLSRVTAQHVESGHTVWGYEIHHGKTEGTELEPLLQHDGNETIGVRSLDGRLWGTYLHGIFDADDFRRWFIDRLRARRGLTPLGKVFATYDLEPAFERLAEAVRESLDMDQIYSIMGL